MSYDIVLKKAYKKAVENNDKVMITRIEDLQNYTEVTKIKPMQMFFTCLEYINGKI